MFSTTTIFLANMDFLYNFLAIPEKCLLDKRVYKKMFYENTDFTVTDKKWFTQDIELITWYYTLKPELLMINGVEEEHYAYDEIVIMDVEVSSFDHKQRLADIMQRSIPYPLLIVFKQEDKVCLSVADKRYSLSDDKAATLNTLWATEPLENERLSDIEEAFLEQLAFDKQPQLHLKAFYHGWLDAFYAYDSSKVTCSFEVLNKQEKKVQRREALEAYRRLEQQITELRATLRKENAFNKKMGLNMEIKKLQDQLNHVSEQL
jgi:hypothetical protein